MNIKLKSFTMAEILLSLTIIGVVAAITLPSLTGNINEKTWQTQKKALYARLSQAILLMGNLNGYGTLYETTDENGSVNVADTAAKTFVTEGLAKVLKINNICDEEHLTDCGIPKIIHTIGDNKLYTSNIKTLHDFNSAFNYNSSFVLATYTLNVSHSQINTKAAAFETVNGENILVYYYPYCSYPNAIGNTVMIYAQPFMCANFVYDLNGKKGPNTVGKDIGFISALYSTDSVVTSAILSKEKPVVTTTQIAATAYCRNKEGTIKLPNKEELISLFYNKILLDIPDNYNDSVFWSSENNGGIGTYVNVLIGGYHPYAREKTLKVRCVER